MKTLTTTLEIKNEIHNTLECHEKHSKAFLLESEISMLNRRNKEKRFYEKYQNYTFTFCDYIYEIEYHYEQAYKNIYYKLRVWKDNKKSNITALKNIVKKLENNN